MLGRECSDKTAAPGARWNISGLYAGETGCAMMSGFIFTNEYTRFCYFEKQEHMAGVKLPLRYDEV